MASSSEIIRKLKAKARPSNLAGMARFGISTRRRLGVSMPEIRRIAREEGRNHRLALELWKTGIAECRIVASIVADPDELTGNIMERWVRDFDSWDVCDQVCMNLFQRSLLARQKIVEWSTRNEEFVKRAAYALLACLAWHEKDAPNAGFLAFLPVIKRGATDNRNYVRKAVSWALRNIGKKNASLKKAALRTAREMRQMDSKAAHWIAADVIRELTHR